MSRMVPARRALPVPAYIDGGTASMVFQLLIAGVVATMFMAKSYWWRLKTFLANLLRRTPHRDE